LSLQRTFEASDPHREIKQKAWDDFVNYYNFINESPLLVKYPDIWYKVQGIVSPRQIVAWRNLINIISEGIFNKIPVALNHNLDEGNLFFLNEYKNHFSDTNNLKITLACGYFWKFLKGLKRREKMKVFYMDKVKNGCKVKIYTKDETLKSEFTSDKPSIKCLPYRMDIHFTIIQPKNKDDAKKTLFFIELPHTENTRYRLDAYFTIGQLKEFGCSEENIKKLLKYLSKQYYLIPHLLFKSLPSKANVAINSRYL